MSRAWQFWFTELKLDTLLYKFYGFSRGGISLLFILASIIVEMSRHTVWRILMVSLRNYYIFGWFAFPRNKKWRISMLKRGKISIANSSHSYMGLHFVLVFVCICQSILQFFNPMFFWFFLLSRTLAGLVYSHHTKFSFWRNNHFLHKNALHHRSIEGTFFTFSPISFYLFSTRWLLHIDSPQLYLTKTSIILLLGKRSKRIVE